MESNIKDIFIDFVCQHFIVESNEIDHDKSMIDEGIIDSFGLVEIATFLEQEFHISITDTDMIRDNFGSVNKIVKFVSRKREHG
jgi:acyl carrier protein